MQHLVVVWPCAQPPNHNPTRAHPKCLVLPQPIAVVGANECVLSGTGRRVVLTVCRLYEATRPSVG
jgi:hypothetical protein